MTFDPNKTWRGESRLVRQAQFWYEFKLYLKVVAILAIPTALALWALLEWVNV